MDIKALMGAVISLAIILLFQTILVIIAKRRAQRSNSDRIVNFMDLIITSEDESYSLSRLQMYLWTVAIIMGYWAIYASAKKFPSIPDSLYMLMGVNFTSAVVATAINTLKSTPTTTPVAAAAAPAAAAAAAQAATGAQPATDTAVTQAAAAAAQATAATAAQANLAAAAQVTAVATARASTPPSFFKDIFFEVKDGKIINSLDLPRTQMFLWTMVSLATYAVMLAKSFQGTPSELPNITSGLVTLMGISNGAYLGAKAAK